MNEKKLDRQTDEKKKETDTLVTEGQTKRKRERERLSRTMIYYLHSGYVR